LSDLKTAHESELSSLRESASSSEGEKDRRITELESMLSDLKTAHESELSSLRESASSSEGEKDRRITELESMLSAVKSLYERQLLALRGKRTKMETRRQQCMEELDELLTGHGVVGGSLLRTPGKSTRGNEQAVETSIDGNGAVVAEEIEMQAVTDGAEDSVEPLLALAGCHISAASEAVKPEDETRTDVGRATCAPCGWRRLGKSRTTDFS
jgi:hypothetical protein